MAGTMQDFRKMADEVRNWGRWGAADELGTLNFITADKVAEAAGLAQRGKVFALGTDFGSNGPQGAFKFRNNPVHTMTVDGGDADTLVRYGPEWLRNAVAHDVSAFFADNPFRFNDDMIVMPLQAASQWDALSHVYYEDKLYNGFPADSVTSFGAYHCGIDKVDAVGITSRGVLLDLVRFRGAEVFLEPGNPVTPEELDAVAAKQGVEVRSGDIVLVHTGWWTRFCAVGDGAEAGLGVGLAVRGVAARARGGRGGGGQPDGRGPGPGRRCRGHLPADAHALPARHGADARRVLGSDGPGGRLRLRRRLRVPARRTAAERRRRGGLAGESDRHQMTEPNDT